MASFKAQILLLLGEYDLVIELLEFGENKSEHLIAQLLRMYNNELNWDEYKEALNDIYGKEQIDKTVNIIEGKEFFVNRNLHLC